MLMVRAGNAVDATIESLIPLLSPGDVIIDGGNSNFDDSIPLDTSSKWYTTALSTATCN